MTHCQNYEQANQIDELEHENRLLRARNERLEKTLEAITAKLEQAGALEVEYNRLLLLCQQLHRTLDAIVPRLEQACGPGAMPPVLIKKFIEEMQ